MEHLGRFWQRFSIDLPWTISNWLWANIVNPLVASLKQITLRRIVYLAAFIIFAWAAAEWYFSADVAMLLVGDSALYFEIMTFAYLAFVRGRVHRIVMPTARMLRAAVRRTLNRPMARARRIPRLPRLFDKDDDVPDGAFA